MSTYVYVDGFNLYYGALKDTTLKWLDLEKFCSISFPKEHIKAIKYFTARVKGRRDNPGCDTRQNAYIRALKTLSSCEIIYGHFLSHPVNMPLAESINTRKKFVKVMKTEEKGSDVNLTAHMLVDGFQNKYDTAIVISNDSDLVTPIKMVKNFLKKKVIVLAPRKRPSKEMRDASSISFNISKKKLAHSQFPHSINDDHGTINIPKEWL